ncbi:helix-turn-helix transcriptional regulator [Weissella uvarum]|nr:helix-turn-helix transcriptional regulator [Weissella uvarum]
MTMIKINLDKLLVERQMKSKDLAEMIGITPANLSILKNGKGRGIRFSTLENLCKALNCQPGDIMTYEE